MRAAWAVGATCVAAALLRAVTATAPAGHDRRLDEAEARAAYEAIAGRDAELRASGRANFPADAWSQDDDFHAMERGAAVTWAHAHGTGLQQVLGAVDDGLRGHWPLADGGAPPRATSAVCRPRPID